MATIIHLRGPGSPTTTGRGERTLTFLVGSMLVALSVVLGAPIVGLAVGALFCGGMLLADLEDRVLRPGEYVAIATLHAAAVVLLSF